MTQRTHGGQSMLEIILAMAIFGLIASSLISLSLGSYSGFLHEGIYADTALMAQESIEAIRTIRSRGFNELVYSTSSVYQDSNTGSWYFSGEGTSETDDYYKREITFHDVCRNTSHVIVTCPGDYTDPHSKEVRVRVYWETLPGIYDQVERRTILTNWDSVNWIQTDWSGGSGQSNWSTTNQYSSDDGGVSGATSGELTLLAQGGDNGACGTKSWPFTTASDYVYSSTSTQVTGGVAKLVSASQSTVSGNTSNASFSGLGGWTSVQWSQDPGDPNVGIGDLGSGGNPSGYAYILVYNDLANKQRGGLITQPITITGVSSTVSCTVDLNVIQAAGASTMDEVFVGVYLETASGVPVGSPIYQHNVTTTHGWQTHAFDCTSAVTATGTYYFKIGVWADGSAAAAGPIQVGIDNAYLSWYGGAAPTLPTTRPMIAPTSTKAYVVSSTVERWNSFNETATKNGGNIYYQLSSDAGTTWKYWNGSAWANATTAGTFNSSSVINANIGTFPTSSKSITFRAFLESNGSQDVQLDEVSIGCSQGNGWDYDNALNYSYPSTIEVTGGVARLTTIGTPTSSGAITNGTFNSNVTGWTYYDWSQDAGDPDVTGYWSASGGYGATGNAVINIPPYYMNKEMGGFFQQALTVPSGITSATCNTYWRMRSFWMPAGGTDRFFVAMYVESNPGAPSLTTSTPVLIRNITANFDYWVVNSDVDCTSWMSTGGTYYVKLAFWLDTLTGQYYNYANTIAFDNVAVSYYKPATQLYSSSIPGITSTVPVTPNSLNRWAGFTEYSSKTGGEIYYKLSEDGGATWRYWNGSTWATTAADSASYSTASVVNTNISSFPTSTKSLTIKAYLQSTGWQQVSLDQVRVLSSEEMGTGSGGGAYSLTGILTSSAFFMGNISPIQAIEWDEEIPVCVGDCRIRVQVRSAPDSGGSPGTWTNWYGATGDGTYFDDSNGQVVPRALNGNSWVQYRVELTGDGTHTPVLREIRLNYR